MLLEDMHAGSGCGWLGLIDNRHARDRRGQPVLWNRALAGLLREAAEVRCESLSEGEKDSASRAIGRLLGKEGSEGRSIVVTTSIHFGPSPDGLDFVTNTQSSREVFSRRPLAETLRTTELAAAGLTGTGEIRLHGPNVDELVRDGELVEKWLKRVVAAGSGKTRGRGRLGLTMGTKCVVAGTPAPPVSTIQTEPGRLRILLRNIEPLCITKTGHPGNILETQSYIPGTTLRGAILTALSAEFVDPDSALRELGAVIEKGEIHFGNAYVVPSQLLRRIETPLCSLRDIEVIPLPLSAEVRKASSILPPMAGGNFSNETIPWWSMPTSVDARWPRAGIERDRLIPNPTAAACKDGEFKRVKSEDYLARIKGQPMYRVRPVITALMRNRTPVARAQRTFDSRRPDADKEAIKSEKTGALFTEFVISEDQFFLADIRFESKEAACHFRNCAGVLFTGHGSDRRWLRVGRGGHPAIIEREEWISDSTALKDISPQAPFPASKETHFTLTLTSDLVIRADDLTFQTTLDGATLARLVAVNWNVGDSEVSPDSIAIDSAQSVLESSCVHGFNTASGSRRPIAHAIRRGSAFLVKSGDERALKQLRQALVHRAHLGQGIGDLQDEGLGRFVIDHDAHSATIGAEESEVEPQVAANEPTTQNRREEVLAKVLEAVTELGLAAVISKTDFFPSRSQWQTLRHQVEIVTELREIESLFETLRQHSLSLGGRRWGGPVGPRRQALVEAIDSGRRQFALLDEQRWFVSFLARWASIQMQTARAGKTGKERVT